MLFSSITFLYIFLPAVLLVYFIVPRKFKNYVLLLSSLIFYFCGEPIYVLLLIFSSVSDYLHSLGIEKYRGTKAAKGLLISSITINLCMLGFFKYADFVIGSINAVAGTAIPLPGIPLPIGISFFTFQTMSYTIDVYRGNAKAEKNLASFGTYVCLFPQLIAGPIVRYVDVSNELQNRKSTIDAVAEGSLRFVLGLSKKVLIANAMGELCTIFRASEKTVVFYWIYAVAFTLQIYFDFSGYSDMAIGLGRIFGFKFPENFDYPYISRSITEFWRRWHMTLGGWFRDYVYIPLGGNRVGKAKWFRNIFIVWLLTGFWHGAEWNFAVWGLMYGILLVLEKLFLGNAIKKAGAAVSHIYVMFIVIISFVIFNADGLSGMVSDLGGLFGAGGIAFCSSVTLYYLKSYAVLFIIAIFCCLPYGKRIALYFSGKETGMRIRTVLEPVLLCFLLIAVTGYLVDGSYNPFLYFRF